MTVPCLHVWPFTESRTFTELHTMYNPQLYILESQMKSVFQKNVAHLEAGRPRDLGQNQARVAGGGWG